LLQIAGAGDELQGIKKGVIELAVAIVVNKADGENKLRADQAKVEYTKVLHFLHPFTLGWKPKALTCSALHDEGIEKVWDLIEGFRDQLTGSGVFELRRSEQNVDWFESLMQASVMEQFRAKHAEEIEAIEAAVRDGELPVSSA
jgi:LAO/AO transport system kinase